MVSQRDDAESKVFPTHLGAQTSSGPFHHQWHQHFKVEGGHKFRWGRGRQTSQDSLRPGVCHHLLVSYEVVSYKMLLRSQTPIVRWFIFLGSISTLWTLTCASWGCQQTLMTRRSNSGIRWLRKAMHLCRTIIREFNSIRAWNPITGFKLALTRKHIFIDWGSVVYVHPY